LCVLYSANEKWKRDLSQLSLVHPGAESFDGLSGFPNHSGGGSDTKSLELGILRISGAAAADEEDARAINEGLARRVVHPKVGARARCIEV
jgi:hypothetical protein